MKDRLPILIFSMLLLIAVSYVQVFQKLMAGSNFSVELINDTHDDAEENTQKTTEENTRETDQDEDPFRLNESIIIFLVKHRAGSKNANYSIGYLGYYPEIVSPPPQT